MYAAHFTCGLAIGSQARRASIGVLLAAAFLPDIVWIVLSAIGIEPAGPAVFFDDWSHSLLSVVLLATLFALCFVRKGACVWVPVWLAVFSHFLLDAIIHPRPIALYPHSSIHVPWDLWRWGGITATLGFTHYWWLQLSIIIPLLSIYALGMRRQYFPSRLVWATVLAVLGLHLIF